MPMPQHESRTASSDRKPRRPGPRAARSSGAEPDLPGFLPALTHAARRLAAHCLERPLPSLGAFAAVLAAGYVSFNALGAQDGRHPAPILPQPKPGPASGAGREARPVPSRPLPERAAAAARPAPVEPEAGQPGRPAAETTASVAPRGERDVLRAQIALSRLGYGPVKDDGRMGPETKAAIERYERDHKLAVTGEATGRTLQDLAARAARKH